MFRTIAKWIYCHNSLKHCWRANSDGDKPSSVFSCMSSIQFTVIQQKTGQGKKPQTLAPEQEGILRAEMFLDGPELHGSNGTLLP